MKLLAAFGALRHAIAAALVVVSVAAETRPQTGLPSAASERSVKAAYIYRFLPYVQWPGEILGPSAQIVVGVVAADDIARELEQLARTRSADARPIVVRRLGPSDSWNGVHVLYADRDVAGRVQQVLRVLQEQAVLTISDADGAAERGFVIGFVEVESRVRFEVNAEAAERSGLKLSSRLLTVALRVRPGAR